MTQHEFIVNDCGSNLANLGESVLRRHLEQTSPEYLDAFDFVFKSTTLYKCNLFITFRHVLNAFCEFLFSFLVPATEELLPTLKDLPYKPRRLMSYLGERMLTVWLLKNRLRIRELKLMQVPNL